MNLEYLKSFYCIAECNSISKASQELHITQPGLSSQLKKLETELGHTLLDRSNQGVSLTPVGEIVFDYAKLIFKLEENLYDDIKKVNADKKKLSIAACQNFGSFYFSSKVHQFEEISQDTNVTINTYNSSEVLKNVLNHDYNLGIIIGSEDCKHVKNSANCDHLDITHFFEDELILCVNSSYPKDTINIKDFLELPFILREKSSSAYSLIEEFVEEMGVSLDTLHVSFSSNSVNITKDSVINSSAAAFFPKSAVEFELEKNSLKKLEFEDLDSNSSIPIDYSLIKRKDYTFDQHEQKFKDFLLTI
ncbi:LysR family transcriptional regulator [Halanaerobacter jeridensis]|uniref:DNA-binding transcriptional LysR family regulator n=1 Tax=Halanaerobacter jeridensis TaxID=706427 RepID=A0A938XX54_9FIRM|nr:LysR family transcriptional regulator [Halanaerobacter jeridensis]MBM7556920.1 DNA-binding transcriptional LysR family regulator [Halanaerobacter jeridensis]